jgi:hypothetical protein
MYPKPKYEVMGNGGWYLDIRDVQDTQHRYSVLIRKFGRRHIKCKKGEGKVGGGIEINGARMTIHGGVEQDFGILDDTLIKSTIDNIFEKHAEQMKEYKAREDKSKAIQGMIENIAIKHNIPYTKDYNGVNIKFGDTAVIHHDGYSGFRVNCIIPEDENRCELFMTKFKELIDEIEQARPNTIKFFGTDNS